jgi:group II intron reverse transcriptase/maturase
MKRSPEKVLSSLAEHSKSKDYKFERLYRILFNEEMFHVAYQCIYAKEGNMTKGSDGHTIDGTGESRINEPVGMLKDESYQPQASKQVYISKKNGKRRPLGVPAFRDKLLQEVIRMILEAIYEGSFENTSHGFRPKRSCHTALKAIQTSFTGVKWFVEGDIKGFFDNIDHDVMINILKERIADDRFIRLIRKFLKAGYIENWTFHNTHSATPQGGIISPILANIYLDKLDKYMVEYKKQFDKGKERKRNPEYRKLEVQRSNVVSKLKTEKNENKKCELVRMLRKIEKERIF